MKQQRMTIQKKMVYDAVSVLHCHPTAQQVYLCVKKEHPSISKATVYRNLSILAASGLLLKIEVPGGADRFDHQTKAHYHMRCERCGGIEDIFMPYDQQLDQSASLHAGCTVSGHTILFRGICPACEAETKAASPAGAKTPEKN